MDKDTRSQVLQLRKDLNIRPVAIQRNQYREVDSAVSQNNGSVRSLGSDGNKAYKETLSKQSMQNMNEDRYNSNSSRSSTPSKTAAGNTQNVLLPSTNTITERKLPEEVRENRNIAQSLSLNMRHSNTSSRSDRSSVSGGRPFQSYSQLDELDGEDWNYR
jgi:hypothetical protein